MSLLQDWRDVAYNQETDKNQLQKFWADYFLVEKGIYEKLLASPDEEVRGTVKELADKYEIDLMHMVGFLDGINDSLKESVDVETLEETTELALDVDYEKLFFNMLEAKAKWLSSLPEWDGVLSEEKRREITKEWRISKQAVSEKTVGRNDPCPCGSGKKYKKCCGKGK